MIVNIGICKNQTYEFDELHKMSEICFCVLHISFSVYYKNNFRYRWHSSRGQSTLPSIPRRFGWMGPGLEECRGLSESASRDASQRLHSGAETFTNRIAQTRRVDNVKLVKIANACGNVHENLWRTHVNRRWNLLSLNVV